MHPVTTRGRTQRTGGAPLTTRSAALLLAAACASSAGPPVKPGFLARRDYVSISYIGVAAADTNGDKIPDLIGLGGADIEVLFGNGNGTFRQGPKTYTGLYNQFYPVASDLNGDRKIDLIFSGAQQQSGPWGLGVSLGNGDGTFQTATFYQIGTDVYPGNVVLGDFNSDGIPDVALSGESGIWLFTGKGGGAFNPGVLTPFSQTFGGEAVAAQFSSGNLDLAVTTSTGFAVFLGNGDGTFQPPQQYNIGLGTLDRAWIATADLNLDGYSDVAVAGYPLTPPAPGYVEVYLGTGTGALTGPAHAQLSPVEQIALGDLNGDGIPDLVGASGFVAFGNGDGTFKAPRYYPVPSGTERS